MLRRNASLEEKNPKLTDQCSKPLTTTDRRNLKWVNSFREHFLFSQLHTKISSFQSSHFQFPLVQLLSIQRSARTSASDTSQKWSPIEMNEESKRNKRICSMECVWCSAPIACISRSILPMLNSSPRLIPDWRNLSLWTTNLAQCINKEKLEANDRDYIGTFIFLVEVHRVRWLLFIVFECQLFLEFRMRKFLSDDGRNTSRVYYNLRSKGRSKWKAYN